MKFFIVALSSRILFDLLPVALAGPIRRYLVGLIEFDRRVIYLNPIRCLNNYPIFSIRRANYHLIRPL